MSKKFIIDIIHHFLFTMIVIATYLAITVALYQTNYIKIMKRFDSIIQDEKYQNIQLTGSYIVIEEPVQIKSKYAKIKNISKKDIDCMAKNLYFEARNQHKEGLEAVFYVTLNRVISRKFPNTICDVVWQRKQFSWTHDGKSDYPKEKKIWTYIQKYVKFKLEIYDMLIDTTEGSLYYHAYYVDPKWSRSHKLTRVAIIGDHKFYKYN